MQNAHHVLNIESFRVEARAAIVPKRFENSATVCIQHFKNRRGGFRRAIVQTIRQPQVLQNSLDVIPTRRVFR